MGLTLMTLQSRPKLRSGSQKLNRLSHTGARGLKMPFKNYFSKISNVVFIASPPPLQSGLWFIVLSTKPTVQKFLQDNADPPDQLSPNRSAPQETPKVSEGVHALCY